jgi:hypothetical protein
LRSRSAARAARRTVNINRQETGFRVRVLIERTGDEQN